MFRSWARTTAVSLALVLALGLAEAHAARLPPGPSTQGGSTTLQQSLTGSLTVFDLCNGGLVNLTVQLVSRPDWSGPTYIVAGRGSGNGVAYSFVETSQFGSTFVVDAYLVPGGNGLKSEHLFFSSTAGYHLTCQ